MKRLTTLVLLAACAAPPVTLPPRQEDTCGMTQNAGLIGQNVTALEKVLILRMVRVIRPGDMVTQDFRPERINFMIGADEEIQSINCG